MIAQRTTLGQKWDMFWTVFGHFGMQHIRYLEMAYIAIFHNIHLIFIFYTCNSTNQL